MSRNNTARPGVQIRILLHLRDYADFRDRVEVPFALSQMGIANVVSIARSNVPRAIGSLKESAMGSKDRHISQGSQGKER